MFSLLLREVLASGVAGAEIVSSMSNYYTAYGSQEGVYLRQRIEEEISELLIPQLTPMKRALLIKGYNHRMLQERINEITFQSLRFQRFSRTQFLSNNNISNNRSMIT
jgi:hypothetical protein